MGEEARRRRHRYDSNSLPLTCSVRWSGWPLSLRDGDTAPLRFLRPALFFYDSIPLWGGPLTSIRRTRSGRDVFVLGLLLFFFLRHLRGPTERAWRGVTMTPLTLRGSDQRGLRAHWDLRGVRTGGLSLLSVAGGWLDRCFPFLHLGLRRVLQTT